MCKEELESVTHIFFECKAALGLWEMFSHRACTPSWRPLNQNHAYDFWASKGEGNKALPYFVCWKIWCNRNNTLFNEGLLDIPRIYMRIMEWLHINPVPDKVCKDLSIRMRPHCIHIPALYFDGAQ